MKKFVAALFLALAPLSAAHAQSMPVSQFLGKADGLKKKGMMAMFSKDIGVLKKEIQNSALAVRAEQLAARKAGRKPATCMPDKIQLNSEELLNHLNSIPAAQRSMPIQQAFRGFMQRKYPCQS